MSVPVLKTLKKAFRGNKPKKKRFPYIGDGLGVKGRIMEFMDNPRFAEAWLVSADANQAGWVKSGGVPDIRWRAHTCCWAAEHALKLPGDFAEFGVHTGILSITICEFLPELSSSGKKFYLFDTFEGIPTEKLSESEADSAAQINKNLYFDVFEIAQKNFSKYPYVSLVKGYLPEAVDDVDIEQISYASIDLNSARYEKLTIEKIWDRIVPSGIVVLDDYLHTGHYEQYTMWNEFAQNKNASILSLPTGQGLLIKPGSQF